MNIRFNNEHDIMIWALSAVLDRFKTEDKLFAAQCVFCLASLIQLTEVLPYYQVYRIFPSDYPTVNNQETTASKLWDQNSNVPYLRLDDTKATVKENTCGKIFSNIPP
jgi:hypothetical protein